MRLVSMADEMHWVRRNLELGQCWHMHDITTLTANFYFNFPWCPGLVLLMCAVLLFPSCTEILSRFEPIRRWPTVVDTLNQSVPCDCILNLIPSIITASD